MTKRTRAKRTREKSAVAEPPKEDNEECYPDVFTIPPPQPKVKKPGQLSNEQVQEFFNKGYVVVKDFLTEEELEAPIQSINELVDALANKLFDAGKIKDKHENASFTKRLTLLEKEFPGTSVLLHKRGRLPKGFQELWSNYKLLNVVEQFIGPDIAGHPIWNLRTKTPSNASAVVPWHQDNAYLEHGADKCMVATAWIPFIDATVKNGCMQVVTEGHKKGKTAKHTCCAGPTWYVEMEEEEMEKSLGVNMKEDVVICEVPLGGVLFINNIIPHRSLPNFSDDIRWSMDLRYHQANEYNYFFGLKDSVLMRSSKEPEYQIEWSKFIDDEAQHKKEAQFAKKAKIDTENCSSDDPFNTTLCGPWMTRWEIVHHNKHSEAWSKLSAE